MNTSETACILEAVFRSLFLVSSPLHNKIARQLALPAASLPTMRLIKDPPPNQRILLASNRLPIKIDQADDGSFKFSMSNGGLVSGISGFTKTTKVKWYGWIGAEIDADRIESLKEQLWMKFDAVPVLLSQELAEQHYNGFSNSILWPLLHYHPGEIVFDEASWESYVEANRIFASTIAEDALDGDFVWIHDYHLMLVPAMLRSELKAKDIKVKIGFFLHVPWPSSEIYRILPVREELLEGILRADLVGFHTFDYVRHFLGSCSRILGLRTTPNGVEFHHHTVTVGAYPIGIDPSNFDVALEKQHVQNQIEDTKVKHEGLIRVIGVDRLDYIKAVPHKLHAFEIFLDRYPEWRGSVQLVQIAVPTRLDVEEYKDLQRATNELTGRINSKYGTPDWTPIVLMFKAVSFDELVVYYAASQVCLVSSMRDGMNLVCLEYIASQKYDKGVLILSEFAGAAQGLSGSISISPYDISGLADAIHQAVTMNDADRHANFAKLAKYVRKHTSAWWGKAFVSELLHVGEQGIHSSSATMDTGGRNAQDTGIVSRKQMKSG